MYDREIADLFLVAALNHEVRNALQSISLNAFREPEAAQNVLEAVNRIDSIMKEILPRIGRRREDEGQSKEERRCHDCIHEFERRIEDRRSAG